MRILTDSRALAVAALLATCSLLACDFDWYVAPDDASGATDASTDAGAAPEASDDAQPTSDAAPDAPRSCAEIAADLAGARRDAKACPTLTLICERQITDECGCRSFLWAPNAAATTRYEALIAEHGAAGCVASGCNCLAGTEGRCLAAGGAGNACTP